MDKKLHFIFLVIDMIYKSLDSEKVKIKKVEHLLEVFQQMEIINVKDDVLLNTIESLLTFLKENKNYWFVILVILWKLFQLQECFIQNKNWNHFFYKLINDCMLYNFSFSDSTIIKQVKKKCVECFNQDYLSPNNNIENNIAILLLIQSKIVENKIFIKEMENNKDKFFAKYIISENINLKFSVMYCTLLLNNKAIFTEVYDYFEKVKQNSEIKEEDLIIAFIDSAINTNSLTSLIFPSLMYELLFSHIEILIQYKENIKQYIHHSLTNAKWAIKVLSLQEKQKIKQQYHSDLSDILSDLSFTDNELSKEYNSIINYLSGTNTK